MAKAYTEDSIKTLDALSHIRKRTGMYIGRLGDGSHPEDGIYILLKEIIDNCIDEFIMHHGQSIEVSIDFDNNQVSVRDFGRGIPLGKVVDCVSKINTGAKYDTEVFQFSVGLNGVGTKAVNALSEHFLVRSVRDKKYVEASFQQGVLLKEKKGRSQEKHGTYIEFIPDPEIFKTFHFDSEYVLKRLWYYAYLNKGLTIIYNGQKKMNQILNLLMKLCMQLGI